MSLIDYTYFIRDINVPLNGTTDSDPAYQDLSQSITKYENEVLQHLLGYTLWKEFKAEIDAESYSTKWANFKDGAEFSFTFNGQTINTKWEGLVNSEKESLIAYYVYFRHRIEKETFYTGIGEKRAKGENSTTADAKPKLIRAWNNMIALYGHSPRYAWKYGWLNNDNYQHWNEEPTAYNYLLANKSDFDSWVFKPLHRKHGVW